MYRTILFVSIILAGKLSAQTPSAQNYEAQPLGLHEELPQAGTYQILLKIGTNDTIVPENVLYKVNLLRHHDNEIFWSVNPATRLRILPYAVIRSNNFVPLPKYAYEN